MFPLFKGEKAPTSSSAVRPFFLSNIDTRFRIADQWAELMAKADARLPEDRPTAAEVGCLSLLCSSCMSACAGKSRQTATPSLALPATAHQVAGAIAAMARRGVDCDVRHPARPTDLSCIEAGRRAMHASSSERCSSKRYC